MSSPKYDGLLEDQEIDRLSAALEKINLKILHKKHSLSRIQIRKKRSIEKYCAKAAFKQRQIADLCDQKARLAFKKKEKENEITKEEEKEEGADLLVRVKWDTRDPKKLVAWQLERHLQWASEKEEWSSLEKMHSMLDLRTARELASGERPGKGNMSLNKEYCKLSPGNYAWGLPAEALLVYARNVFKDAGAWMLKERTRELLIGMEDWFFSLEGEVRGSLPLNADDWDDMPEGVTRKWNAAVVGGEPIID